MGVPARLGSIDQRSAIPVCLPDPGRGTSQRFDVTTPRRDRGETGRRREGRAVFDVVRSTDGTSDWRLVGELDLATAGDLHSVILPWLEGRAGGGSVTFEASDLTFIDSTGVRTLYSLTGPPHDARVVLRNPSEEVWRALGMVGLVTNARETPAEVAIEHLGHWEPI